MHLIAVTASTTGRAATTTGDTPVPTHLPAPKQQDGYAHARGHDGDGSRARSADNTCLGTARDVGNLGSGRGAFSQGSHALRVCHQPPVGRLWRACRPALPCLRLRYVSTVAVGLSVRLRSALRAWWKPRCQLRRFTWAVQQAPFTTLRPLGDPCPRAACSSRATLTPHGFTCTTCADCGAAFSWSGAGAREGKGGHGSDSAGGEARP